MSDIPIECSHCEITLVEWRKYGEKLIKITKGDGVDCPMCETYSPTYYL